MSGQQRWLNFWRVPRRSACGHTVFSTCCFWHCSVEDVGEAKGLIDGMAGGAMRDYFELKLQLLRWVQKPAMMQVTQLITGTYRNGGHWLAQLNY